MIFLGFMEPTKKSPLRKHYQQVYIQHSNMAYQHVEQQHYQYEFNNQNT